MFFKTTLLLTVIVTLWAQSNADCPNGDVNPLNFSNRKDITTCDDYLKIASCTLTSVRSLCCATCAKRATGDPKCPYGDEMLNYKSTGPMTCTAYLAKMGNAKCVVDYVKGKCCSSCIKAATGSAACRFGDAKYVHLTGIGKKSCGEIISQFGKNQCKNDFMKRDCCASCGVTGGSTGGSNGGSAGGSGSGSSCTDTLHITSGGKSYDCAEFLKVKGGAKCNDAQIKKGCCVSCAKKATGNPKCPYGDQEPLMFTNQKDITTCAEYLKVVSCTMPNVKSLCCDTCAKRATGDPNCPYGDEMLNFKGAAPRTCTSYLAERGNGECMQGLIQKKCCSSCKRAATGNPACQYGDVAYVNLGGAGKKTCGQIITNYGKNQCNNGWMKKKCCAACGL